MSCVLCKTVFAKQVLLQEKQNKKSYYLLITFNLALGFVWHYGLISCYSRNSSVLLQITDYACTVPSLLNGTVISYPRHPYWKLLEMGHPYWKFSLLVRFVSILGVFLAGVTLCLPFMLLYFYFSFYCKGKDYFVSECFKQVDVYTCQ